LAIQSEKQAYHIDQIFNNLSSPLKPLQVVAKRNKALHNGVSPKPRFTRRVTPIAVRLYGYPVLRDFQALYQWLRRCGKARCTFHALTLAKPPAAVDSVAASKGGGHGHRFHRGTLREAVVSIYASINGTPETFTVVA